MTSDTVGVVGRRSIDNPTLLQFALDGVQLIRGGFVRARYGNWMQTYRVASREYATLLTHAWRRAYGARPSTTEVEDVQFDLVDKAQADGLDMPVAVRVARVGDSVWYDLCNDAGQVVEVTAHGIHTRLDAECPVAFRRSFDMRALPVPEEGGTLDELREFVRASAEDQTLIHAWLVAASFPQGPYAGLFFQGGRGSTKTTACRMVVELVDPREGALRFLSRSVEDVFVSAKDCRLVVFENVSHVSREMADVMCTLSTGTGYARRKRWSDSDVELLDVQAPMLMNGINAPTEHADLLERLLVISLPLVPENERIPELDLKAKFAEAKPRIFHAILRGVQSVLRNLATPPRASIRAQQAAFDKFRAEYNDVRPHEALGMCTPSKLYRPSPRQMPISLQEHEYPSSMEARRVRRDGTIKWTGGYVFIGEAMAHEIVGLEQTDDEHWQVHLGPMRLGVLHERSRTVVPVTIDVDPPSVTHVPGQASTHHPRRRGRRA